MEFYASMCNKRNNTWKRFVEKSCKFDSLANKIMEEKITYDVRAIICFLFNKVWFKFIYFNLILNKNKSFMWIKSLKE